MPELPDVPYQLPALQGRPEWMHPDWVDWFRKLARAANGEPWTDVSFNAANFTGNGGMTWTLTAPDQVAYAYRTHAGEMTVSFSFNQTSVGGVLDTLLQFPVPAGKAATKQVTTAIGLLSDNGTTVPGTMIVSPAINSGRSVVVRRADGAAFAASANNTA